MTSLPPPAQDVDAWSECERLIRRFAWLNDLGRHDELAGLFVEDGSFTRPTAPDTPIVGRTAILDSFRARPRRVQCHFVSNVVIDPAPDGSFVALSSVLLAAGPNDGASGEVATAADVLFGEFRDVIVKAGKDWRFKSRTGKLVLRVPLTII